MSTAFKSKIAKAGFGLLAGVTLMASASSALALSAADVSMLLNAGIINATQAAALMASTGGTTSTTTSGSCYQFTTALSMGSNGEAVRQLQMVLNKNATTALAVAAGSNGSAGNESTYFGAATKAAVMKYQAANGLSQVGLVGPATRAKLNAGCTTTGTTTGGSTTTQTGPVSVSLATDNPASGYIINSQATADLVRFAFAGNGTVTSVTLHRSGISDQNTLSNVYLYDGMTRLTDGYSFNSNGDIVITGLNIMVSGMKTISVKADVSSTAASTASTLAVSLTNFVANGTSVSANVAGNVMTTATASASSGSASFSGTNTAAGGYGASTATVNAGTMGYSLFAQDLQVNNRALLLKSVNLRMVGSAPSDAISNYKFYVDGLDTGSTGTMTNIMGSNYVVLNFATPVNLSTGRHTLELRGDVQKGASRTAQFSLQNAADLVLYDSQIGINVAVTSFSASQAGTFTISQGTTSVEIDPSFNSVLNVTGGSSNVTIAKFKVHAYGEDVKVQTLGVELTGTASAAGIQNVTLFYNGSQVGAQQNVASGASLSAFSLGSQMILPAGSDVTVEVRADLINAAGSNITTGTIGAKLTQGSSNAQGQSSQNTVNFPAGTTAVKNLTVQTGSLAVAKNSSYTSQTLNPNTAKALIGSFVLQNQNTSESVRVTNLQVALALTTEGSTNYSNLVTDETSGSGAVAINPTSAAGGATSTNNFSVDFTLAAGATKTVNVYATLGSASSGSVVVTLSPSARGVSSNVTLTVTPAVGQTITLGTGTFGTPTVVTSATTQAQFVSGGSTTGATDASKARFNVTATNGTALISELKFTNTATSGTVTTVRVGSTTAPMVSDVAYFTGLNLTVPNGGTGLDIDAFASYAPVGSTGVTSGSQALLKLCYIKYTIGSTTSEYGSSTCASGLISSAQQMTLVGSKPTVTATQPAGVILSTGAVEAIDVTITADAAGPISVTSFPITASLSASGGTPAFTTGTTFTVKDASNNSVALAANTGAVNQFTATSGGSATVTLGSAYVIAAGQSQTFKVFLPVTSVGTGTLPNTYMYTALATGSGFSWTDVAGGGSATTGTANIYNYPSTFTSSIHN